MWRVLDVHGNGKLTRWTVNYFFRDIVARMNQRGEEPVNVRGPPACGVAPAGACATLT